MGNELPGIPFAHGCGDGFRTVDGDVAKFKGLKSFNKSTMLS